VLEQSCRQAREWLDRGVPFGCIAVNLCASQINTADIFDSMIATVESFGLGAEHIEFELSETALIESNEQVHDAIAHLVERGYRFAVDEFGVGFAPFALLRRLHTHKLKIAPNFIADIASDPKAAAVVESLVGLGRALDMQVVAEGVEDERQAELLRGFGCELAQGGMYGIPSTAEQTESLVLAKALS
jgi:EAL domain-containing protein (putative c-di-GMP-specific phosphodiesterase class I)